MSTPTAKPNPESDDKGTSMGLSITISGKIDSFKEIKPKESDPFFQTLVIVPAKDAFSHPITFAIRSDSRLGLVGAHVSVPCELRAYSRKKDGEKYYNINLWATN